MARRLILDTGILIAGERGGIVGSVDEDDDVAIAAVTLAELLTGVELAEKGRRRERRAAYVNGLQEILPIIEYDEIVAVSHARLLAHVRRAGKPRGAHDLIIAATAVATDRELVTADRAARFEELPGLRVTFVPAS